MDLLSFFFRAQISHLFPLVNRKSHIFSPCQLAVHAHAVCASNLICVSAFRLICSQGPIWAADCELPRHAVSIRGSRHTNRGCENNDVQCRSHEASWSAPPPRASPAPHLNIYRSSGCERSSDVQVPSHHRGRGHRVQVHQLDGRQRHHGAGAAHKIMCARNLNHAYVHCSTWLKSITEMRRFSFPRVCGMPALTLGQVGQIYEGTSNIQLQTIANILQQEYKSS
jgi:hypothetical protein